MTLTPWSKVLYTGLVFLSIGLPFYKVGFPIWIGVALCGLGGLMLFGKGKRTTGRSPFTFLTLCFFLAEIVWLIGTDDLNNGLQNILLKISLILVPASMLVVDHGLTRKHLQTVVLTLIVATAVSALIKLVLAIQHSLTEDKWLITYADLSNWVHPGYYGILIGVVIILCFWFMHKTNGERPIQPLIGVPLFIFLLMILVLLSARMQIISIVLLAAILGLFNLGKGLNFKTLVAVAVASICLCGTGYGLYKYNPRLNTMVTELSAVSLNPGEHLNSIETRLVVWSLGFESAMESPIIGHGTADTKKLIQAKAVKVGHNSIVEKDMGVHNEYLDAWVTKGLLGLALVLLLIIQPLLRSLKTGNLALSGLAIFFGMSLLTESVLEREMGVITFALVIPLTMLYHQTKDDARS